jgi:hypothetical protein
MMMIWRLAVHEESPNGRVSRWLAGSKRRNVLTSAMGEK